MTAILEIKSASASLSSRLVFNIIYIPGTVRYLSFFVLSLLKWSDCSYRLVSNGCLPEEITQLKKLCSKSSRLEFFMLSDRETLRHAEALETLQKMEQSDHFCFMDSDILATGPFLEELIPRMTGKWLSISSGSAIGHSKSERIAGKHTNILRGSHSYLGKLCVGSTYFAIYNNRNLSRFIRSNGVAFNRYRSWEDVPERFRSVLSRAGLRKDVYDTGKLLTLLAQIEGEQIIYKNCENLLHIGRLSGFVRNNPNKKPAPYRSTFKIKGLMGILHKWQDARVVEKNRRISGYFLEFFDSLFENRPFKRRVPVFHPEVRKNIRTSIDRIRDLYREILREHAELFQCKA